MNKSKRLLTLILVLCMCMTMVFLAVACNDTDDDTTDNGSVTSETAFPNGDFISYTGDSYPATPTNWSGNPGSSSSSSATPTGENNLISGVIDVSDTLFKKNRSKYGRIDNPGKIGTDDKIMMIYNKTETSYKYDSDSVSISKNDYFKLSLNVKTDQLSGKDNDQEYGVYIYVNGDAYASFKAINTNNTWQKYELYIEASKIQDTSLTVTVSLGVGSTTTGHMTKGYAFFDNFVIENLSDVAEGKTPFTKDDYNKITTSPQVAKYSMETCDGNFDFVSDTTKTPYTPTKFTYKAGTGDGENAPTSSSHSERGIVDPSMTINNGDGQKIDITKASDNSSDTMLMLNNKKLTAVGYRANVPMHIANGKVYKISLKVRTIAQEGTVTVMLTDGTDSDALNFIYDKINTNSNWQTIEFFIQGNDLRANKVYLEMWAGTGGENETTTHFRGAAFFDDCTIEVVDDSVFDPLADYHYSFQKSNPTQIALDTFQTLEKTGFINDNARTNFKMFNINDFAAQGFDCENPKTVSSNATTVLGINNFLPSSYVVSNILKGQTNIDTTNATNINPNSYYLISVWVKTVNVKKSLGLTVNLVRYNDEITSNEHYFKAVTSLASIENFNSLNMNEDDLAVNNGYTELSFYIQGHQLEQKKIGLELTFGTGTTSQSSLHAMGFAFVNNFTYEIITPSEYNTASEGTTIKKSALTTTASSTEVSSNGLFNNIDIPATETLYTDDATSKTKTIFENGALKDYLGVPTNWTINNKDALTNNTGTAGIMQLANYSNAPQEYAALGFSVNPEYPTTGTPLNTKAYPHVLAIRNSDSLSHLGYTSSSISLTENSYYIFEVWAKTATNKKFSIELSTTGDAGEDSTFNNYSGTGDWQLYRIYVQTGISSVSVKLGLYSGDPKSSLGAANEVYFTGATYSTITKDAFNQKDTIGGQVKTKSWLVDTFSDYTIQEDALSVPKSWSAAAVENDAPVDSESRISGVFNRTRDDWKLLDINADTQQDLINKIFATDKNIGNSLFALYNKEKTAYRYNSASHTLEAEQYYKISIWALTYGLASNESAFISLKVNNKTYSYGLLNATTNNGKLRRVNTSTYAEDGTETVGTWQEFNFYIKTEKGVTPSISLSMGLGYAGKDNYIKGTLFADNFSVLEIEEADFIARQPIEGESESNLDQSSIAAELVPNNIRIVFTKEDAAAEEGPEETPEDDKPNLNWLYITSGVIGGVIVVVVIIVLVKKFAPRRKRKLTQATANKPKKKTDNRDKFND